MLILSRAWSTNLVSTYHLSMTKEYNWQIICQLGPFVTVGQHVLSKSVLLSTRCESCSTICYPFLFPHHSVFDQGVGGALIFFFFFFFFFWYVPHRFSKVGSTEQIYSLKTRVLGTNFCQKLVCLELKGCQNWREMGLKMLNFLKKKKKTRKWRA